MGLEVTGKAIYGFSLGYLSADELNNRLEQHNFTLDEDLILGISDSSFTVLNTYESLPGTKGIQLFNTSWGEEECNEKIKWYIGINITHSNSLPDQDTTFDEIKAFLEKSGLFDENKHDKNQLLIYASANIY